MRRSFRPSVEGFEDRRVPACTVTATAGVLTIVGDAAADHIDIQDSGDGTVQGSATGWGDFSFTGIESVVIDTGGGNDHLAYNFAGDLQPGIAHSLEVNLRDGNDQFAATFRGENGPSNMLPDSLLGMKVVGEQGNDRISIDAAGVTMDHATMKIGFYGGEGNDQIDMGYNGHLDQGGVSFFAYGNEGNDTIRLAMVADDTSVAAHPAGFRGVVEGGDGNDAIFFHQAAPAAVSTPGFNNSIDAGDGTDTVHTDLDPLNVLNAETVQGV
jgi:hypothetical protein